MNLKVTSIFNHNCKLKDIQSGYSQHGNYSMFDFENMDSSAGVLIWHILEDRIFLSEGLCGMMKMSKTGLLNLELQFWMDAECELRQYLRNILDQVCSNEIADTSFKTRIPGIEKEIFGSVQLFDRDDLGIMDMMVICWG